jgi:hypothetical protein
MTIIVMYDCIPLTTGRVLVRREAAGSVQVLIMAAEDALAMAEAIREGDAMTVRDHAYEDAFMSLDEAVLTWKCDGWHADLVGGASDWGGAFADEMERAAKEAMR